MARIASGHDDGVTLGQPLGLAALSCDCKLRSPDLPEEFRCGGIADLEGDRLKAEAPVGRSE